MAASKTTFLRRFSRQLVIGSLALLVTLTGCGSKPPAETTTTPATPEHARNAEPSPVGEVDASVTKHPEERWKRIAANYTKVNPTMTEADVRDILGEPDQIHPLYEPVKLRARRIGTSWFYMRDPKPDADRCDTEVVIRFDNAGNVTTVDTSGNVAPAIMPLHRNRSDTKGNRWEPAHERK